MNAFLPFYIIVTIIFVLFTWFSGSISAQPLQAQKDFQAAAESFRKLQGNSLKDNRNFEGFIRNGKTWMKENKDGVLTILIFNAGSDISDEKIMEALEKEYFRSLSMNLYLLENKNSINQYRYILCYGEFNDTKNATETKNSLPAEIRQYVPYVINIEDVVDEIMLNE